MTLPETALPAGMTLSEMPAKMAALPQVKPFDGAHWTYPMLLLWVYFRDPDEVNIVGDGQHWAEIMLDLRAARRLHRTELPPPQFRTQTDPKADIIAKLGAGAVDGIGLENGGGDPRRIDREYWSNAQIHLNSKTMEHYAGPADDMLRGPDATRWYRLRFERERALKAWPPLVASQPSAAITTTPDNDEANAAPANSPPNRRLHKKTRLKVAAIKPIVRRMIENGQMGSSQESICDDVRAAAKRINADLTFPKKRQGMWPIIKLAQIQAEAEICRENATKPGIVAQQKTV